MFGLIGGLMFSGVFGKVATSVLFLMGLLSLGLVLLVGICLVGAALFAPLRRSEWRVYMVQLLCDSLPAGYFVYGYFSKTQLYTPPGCC
jgi:hypothetical protein